MLGQERDKRGIERGVKQGKKRGKRGRRILDRFSAR